MSETQRRLQRLRAQAAGLIFYSGVLEAPAGQAFLQLLDALIQQQPIAAVSAYSSWLRSLLSDRQSWPQWLMRAIRSDDNQFSRWAQFGTHSPLPELWQPIVRHDLQTLQQLAEINPSLLAPMVQAIGNLPALPPCHLEAPRDREAQWAAMEDWAELLPKLVQHYQRRGVGLFHHYWALRWQQGQLQGIEHPDPVALSDLAGYEFQKETLKRNTEFLLAGLPAQNVLLYGSRGAGKSSLVKALVNAYGDRGLRLIEVGKADLQALPQILDRLRESALRFIIFVDDLSFEDDDETFKALKVVLEGSLTARPPNVAVYATSNRRHLVREYFDERPNPTEAKEVHAWDSVQEKLSFSDRFGLTLTFEPVDQDTYLAIVRHLANEVGLTLPSETLEFRAKQWATRHNGRSGRTARQFMDWLIAEQGLPNSLEND
ncbi:ATP-binding protein [Synechococcus elongatus]|uniref:ATP-binding protein n=1 Tax=Synechococcus elongatus PCC 11801 TaxID=2219813 RepID=A0AAN1QL86_SYNEL|nr:ATP-binding protein [Synechococcus elongatus]AZB71381.1 AAA+ family ATPase [Synechococcus elongatus PCC 11801]